MQRRSGWIKPKQSLGQNFLIDENIVRKTIKSLHPLPEECFLEIGPGRGALTRFLAPLVKTLILVEIDGRVIDELRAAYNEPGMTILHEDIMHTDFSFWRKHFGRQIRVVGNIPYHLTSPILFRVFDYAADISDCTLMVQREVAQRMTAQPRTKEYGILSIFCRFYGQARLLFDVSPHCFSPKPKVTSSMVQVELRQPPLEGAKKELFRTIVRTTFGKRRKTLRNSLLYLPYNPDAVASAVKTVTFPLDKRPEELMLDDFLLLTDLLATRLGATVYDVTPPATLRDESPPDLFSETDNA
jgi:16S rRNA (adenine1518-N6/adenine1519-N6)-dimethyltransferase